MDHTVSKVQHTYAATKTQTNTLMTSRHITYYDSTRNPANAPIGLKNYIKVCVLLKVIWYFSMVLHRS